MSSYKEIIKRSRLLRKNQTEAEKIIWEIVRNKRFNNLKFSRQYPIIYNNIKSLNYFIVDFYCHEKKIVLEVDGKIHEFQKEYDSYREVIISEFGLKIIRIKNEETENVYELKKKMELLIMA